MEWRPNPGPQAELFTRPEYEILYGGARGGGKTDAIIMDQLRGINHARYRGLILRKTYPELREIVDRSIMYFSKIKTTGGKILKPKYNASDHVWTFPSGAKIEFGSMVHEESKLHYIGREFTRISFDQLEQFSNSQYLYMFGQVRTSDPDLVNLLGILSTANPGGPGHAWVKARFIDNKKPYQRYESIHKTELGEVKIDSVYIPAKVYDNPKITETNPQYLAMLMSLPDDLRAAWLDGNWDIFVGQFFNEFRPSVHGIEPFEIPNDGMWQIFGGLDYGEFAPTSFGLYAISYDGILIRLAEYYHSGGADEHARMILQTIKDCKWTGGKWPKYIFADPTMWIRRKLDVAVSISAAQTLQSYGLTNLVPASNNRIHGWREMKRRLHWEMSDKGKYLIKPSLFYFNGQCPEFERTLPSCVYPSNMEKNVEDMDKKGEDHVADECRYLCMGVRPPDMVEPEEREPVQDAHHIGHKTARDDRRRKRDGGQVGGIARTFADLQ